MCSSDLAPTPDPIPTPVDGTSPGGVVTRGGVIGQAMASSFAMTAGNQTGVPVADAQSSQPPLLAQPRA